MAGAMKLEFECVRCVLERALVKPWSMCWFAKVCHIHGRCWHRPLMADGCLAFPLSTESALAYERCRRDSVFAHEMYVELDLRVEPALSPEVPDKADEALL